MTSCALSWIQGLSHTHAMALEDYPDGTCFRTAFIGHASAMSQAYYSPLRGASLSLFRHSFVLNFMHGTWRLPSLQGQGVGGEVRHDVDSVFDVAAGMQTRNTSAAVTQHVIYLYNKTKDDIAPGFRRAHPCVVFCHYHRSSLTLFPSQLRVVRCMFLTA